MTDETKHETPAGHGGYEHQDLQTSSILYFLLTILVGTAICMGVLRGIFVYLDHREKASQPEVNPLITNVPSDTRHIAPGYPQSAFPRSDPASTISAGRPLRSACALSPARNTKGASSARTRAGSVFIGCGFCSNGGALSMLPRSG